MAPYRLTIKPSAAKEIEHVPDKKLRQRIVASILALAANPFPPDTEKLSGQSKFRIRVGTYRILYEIDGKECSITIVKVGHRRDVYRK